ncbi:sensor histidine kinase [Taibaiella chishuiensis]|uniref:histidine kinase n=1 Tax=Taibaiella chishuiensis TaxID=1434707 RepID=A0A2P8D5W7_9BACT|nr:sensor histidine kinase [Taibaiella chishuiensis]PSK92598.1 signal transduction histidine kinase [Taibaiella chishuiensis]
MPQQTNEILVTILGGTAILLFFALTLIFLIVLYRKKQREYYDQRLKLEEEFRQELLQAQLEAQESTFHSLSQELHDNIGQVLSLAKLNISLIAMNDQEPIREHVTQTKELLNTAINDLRDISKTLNTDYVKEKNLEESILRELDMLKRTRKFETDFETRGTAFTISPERRLILYRMIQECLNNTVKHAGATHVAIKMDYTDTALNISVRDNGNGFDMQQTGKGVGILNMEHRSKLIGCTLSITSTPGKGTQIGITVNSGDQ